MKRADLEELFTDGWRDPTDDGRRLVAYAMAVLGLVGALGMATYALWGLSHLHQFVGAAVGVSEDAARVLAWVLIGSGSILALYTGSFLFRESKRWDLRRLTLDRFAAGAIVIGLVAIIFGFERMETVAQPGRSVSSSTMFFWVGGGILALCLLVGLLHAVWPKIRRTRRFEGVTVESRVAVDHRMVSIPDHPCPWGEGLTPIVDLRLKDGRHLHLKPTHTAYEFAASGAYGVATVRGDVLERFEPKQRVGPSGAE